MSKKAALGFAVCLIVGLIFGYGLGVSSVNTRDLQRQIEDLQGQLADANSEISSLTSERSTLQGQLLDANSQVTSLTSQVSALQTEITLLKQQLVLGVYFSPKGGCEGQILYWISRANTSIHILMYSFTLDSISDELIEAHRRGIDVKVVFEKQQITEYSEYQKLKAAGVAVRNDTNSDLMHDKIMIIDNAIVLTGSFNWSSAGENENNENLIVIRRMDIADLYEQEFSKIWSESIA